MPRKISVYESDALTFLRDKMGLTSRRAVPIWRYFSKYMEELTERRDQVSRLLKLMRGEFAGDVPAADEPSDVDDEASS